MSRPEIERLDRLDPGDVLAVVARGAHILHEHGVSLEGLVSVGPDNSSKPVGALINPLVSPLEIPASSFGEGRILVRHNEPNSVIVDGEQRKLRPMPFKVLAVLAANRGNLVPHDFTLQAVWPDFSPESYERNGLTPSTKISVYLHAINKVLGERDLGHPGMGAIRGVRGAGHIAVISRDVRPDTAIGE